MVTFFYMFGSLIDRGEGRQLQRVRSIRSGGLYTTESRYAHQGVSNVSGLIRRLFRATAYVQSRATDIVRRVKGHLSKSIHLAHRILSDCTISRYSGPFLLVA